MVLSNVICNCVPCNLLLRYVCLCLILYHYNACRQYNILSAWILDIRIYQLVSWDQRLKNWPFSEKIPTLPLSKHLTCLVKPTVYCILIVKKFRCFTSLSSFPEKLSRLPAFTYTSPIIVAKIRLKSFAVATKNATLFHRKQKATYGIHYCISGKFGA